MFCNFRSSDSTFCYSRGCTSWHPILHQAWSGLSSTAFRTTSLIRTSPDSLEEFIVHLMGPEPVIRGPNQVQQIWQSNDPGQVTLGLQVVSAEVRLGHFRFNSVNQVASGQGCQNMLLPPYQVHAYQVTSDHHQVALGEANNFVDAHASHQVRLGRIWSH